MEFLNHPVLWKEVRQLKRGELLIRPGVVETHTYRVVSGALRMYYLSEEAEHTVRFAYKGSIFSSIPSFFTGNAGIFYIEAIRETVLSATPKLEFNTFLETQAEARAAYQKMLEQLIADQIDRELDLLTTSPFDRYERVFKRSPQLFQEVPAKYIASYLRMSPETLSRIRKDAFRT